MRPGSRPAGRRRATSGGEERSSYRLSQGKIAPLADTAVSPAELREHLRDRVPR
jgi:hypothetical protein